MKIKETIKEATIIQIISAMFGVLILLIGSIYLEALPVILPIAIQQLSKTVLLKIATLAISLFVLMFVVSLSLFFQLRNKLTPKFGVKWDKNHEAYCASCDIPLSESHSVNDEHFFYCVKCRQTIPLTHLGKRITLPEALKILNNKK